MSNINELIEKANEVLNWLVEELENPCYDYMDLKLHDVSWYMYKDMENDFPLCYKEEEENNVDYFSWFCEEEYDSFIEWCKENHIDFNKMCNHIGRTSRFYLHNWYDSNIDYIIDNIMCNVAPYYNNGYYRIENGIIIDTDYEDYSEETEDELLYLIENFKKDFEKEAEDIKTVYQYINDFKTNQVEIFKDFLDYYECSLKEDARREAEKEANDLNTATEIVNKYKISSDDIKSLKMTIYTL